MKRSLVLVALLLLLAACAPAAQTSFPRYDASTGAIMQKIVAVATAIKPDAFHQPFKVKSRSDLKITLVANDISGNIAFMASPPNTVSFELQPRSNGVIVIASGSGASDAVTQVYAALDKAFVRVSK
jgi:hypothetical protein